uniref:Centrosomal protein of 70 kDa n=1 Tax=Chromera velia CCMP2878 TaxID=1169474 RepID=A0A0G4H4E8_9ALVE|eukprot:Cvel_24664.t1-p1 / transcript=Cvel_24664.t1 / gene=Cvel_24664 / organism=Chromera_velia_CCMP2878 / gene_product=hypothetical protein / transcript_product=hypothetical protein / location=Cvel_scaffold2698:7913-18623(-) / protein_length=1892 / sequence_SO=supercontig / SO=protein_coding / is_pseudo=false
MSSSSQLTRDASLSEEENSSMGDDRGGRGELAGNTTVASETGGPRRLASHTTQRSFRSPSPTRTGTLEATRGDGIMEDHLLTSPSPFRSMRLDFHTPSASVEFTEGGGRGNFRAPPPVALTSPNGEEWQRESSSNFPFRPPSLDSSSGSSVEMNAAVAAERDSSHLNSRVPLFGQAEGVVSATRDAFGGGRGRSRMRTTTGRDPLRPPSIDGASDSDSEDETENRGRDRDRDAYRRPGTVVTRAGGPRGGTSKCPPPPGGDTSSSTSSVSSLGGQEEKGKGRAAHRIPFVSVSATERERVGDETEGGDRNDPQEDSENEGGDGETGLKESNLRPIKTASDTVSVSSASASAKASSALQRSTALLRRADEAIRRGRRGRGKTGASEGEDSRGSVLPADMEEERGDRRVKKESVKLRPLVESKGSGSRVLFESSPQLSLSHLRPPPSEAVSVSEGLETSVEGEDRGEVSSVHDHRGDRDRKREPSGGLKGQVSVSFGDGGGPGEGEGDNRPTRSGNVDRLSRHGDFQSSEPRGEEELETDTDINANPHVQKAPRISSDFPRRDRTHTRKDTHKKSPLSPCAPPPDSSEDSSSVLSLLPPHDADPCGRSSSSFRPSLFTGGKTSHPQKRETHTSFRFYKPSQSGMEGLNGSEEDYSLDSGEEEEELERLLSVSFKQVSAASQAVGKGRERYQRSQPPAVGKESLATGGGLPSAPAPPSDSSACSSMKRDREAPDREDLAPPQAQGKGPHSAAERERDAPASSFSLLGRVWESERGGGPSGAGGWEGEEKGGGEGGDRLVSVFVSRRDLQRVHERLRGVGLKGISAGAATSSIPSASERRGGPARRETTGEFRAGRRALRLDGRGHQSPPHVVEDSVGGVSLYAQQGVVADGPSEVCVISSRPQSAASTLRGGRGEEDGEEFGGQGEKAQVEEGASGAELVAALHESAAAIESRNRAILSLSGETADGTAGASPPFSSSHQLRSQTQGVSGSGQRDGRRQLLPSLAASGPAEKNRREDREGGVDEERFEKEKEDTTSAREDAEREIERSRLPAALSARAAAEEAETEARRELRRVEREKSELLTRLRAAEHQNKTREIELQKVRTALDKAATLESKRIERENEVLEKLKSNRMKAQAGGGSGNGPFSAASALSLLGATATIPPGPASSRSTASGLREQLAYAMEAVIALQRRLTSVETEKMRVEKELRETSRQLVGKDDELGRCRSLLGSAGGGGSVPNSVIEGGGGQIASPLCGGVGGGTSVLLNETTSPLGGEDGGGRGPSAAAAGGGAGAAVGDFLEALPVGGQDLSGGASQRGGGSLSILSGMGGGGGSAGEWRRRDGTRFLQQEISSLQAEKRELQKRVSCLEGALEEERREGERRILSVEQQLEASRMEAACLPSAQELKDLKTRNRELQDELIKRRASGWNGASARSLMKRDRDLHTLGLKRAADIPSSELLEIVQDCCRILRITDAFRLVEGVEKVADACLKLPAMTENLKALAAAVWRRQQRRQEPARGRGGAVLVPQEQGAGGPDEDEGGKALEALGVHAVCAEAASWGPLLEELDRKEGFLNRLFDLVCGGGVETAGANGVGLLSGGAERSGAAVSPNDARRLLLLEERVKVLCAVASAPSPGVGVEGSGGQEKANTSEDVAGGAVQGKGKGKGGTLLTTQAGDQNSSEMIVSHAMRLFDTKDEASLPARLSAVHRRNAELSNLWLSLCSSLGLNPDRTSIHQLLAAVGRLLPLANKTSVALSSAAVAAQGLVPPAQRGRGARLGFGAESDDGASSEGGGDPVGQGGGRGGRGEKASRAELERDRGVLLHVMRTFGVSSAEALDHQVDRLLRLLHEKSEAARTCETVQRVVGARIPAEVVPEINRLIKRAGEEGFARGRSAGARS